MFLQCSLSYSGLMTREDLLRLIARAIRRSFTFASDSQALGAADTVLRDLKAVGIRMLAPRSARGTLAPPPPSPGLASDGGFGVRGGPTEQRGQEREAGLAKPGVAPH